MKINFTKKYLEELYEEGKASGKKHRFQKDIIKRYKNTIDKLKAAHKIEDLYPIKSLNYEKLSGDKKGLEAVRVMINTELNLYPPSKMKRQTLLSSVKLWH